LQLPISTRAQGAADPLLDFLARYAWPWFQTRRLQSYPVYSDLEIPPLLDQIRQLVYLHDEPYAIPNPPTPRGFAGLRVKLNKAQL
jgi:hypothetical protein